MNLISDSYQRYRLSASVALIILITPLVLMGLSLHFTEDPKTMMRMRWLFSENKPVELITFFALGAAGIMGLRQAYRLSRHRQGWLFPAFYAVFGTGLLFVAMEEISWGQWFFYYDTPEIIRNVNKQQEMNFHNLPALHAPFEILRVAFGAGGLLAIALSYINGTRIVGAPLILVFWFIVITIIAAMDLHNYFVPLTRDSIYVVAARQVEPLEMFIGCAALLYMWLNTRQLNTVE